MDLLFKIVEVTSSGDRIIATADNLSFLRRIVGSLFPKEQVPASIPPTPREAGTTLTSIVAFPCV
jgi:hypothetical protein